MLQLLPPHGDTFEHCIIINLKYDTAARNNPLV